MTIIEPKVEVIAESNPFKKIEMASRTCYKSERNITEDSAIKMYNRLVKSNHTAMLEHATFIFSTNWTVYNEAKKNPFLHATETLIDLTDTSFKVRYIVSGNLRAINESRIDALIGCLGLNGLGFGLLAYATWSPEAWASSKDVDQTRLIFFEDIKNPTEEEIRAHKYTTMRFVTDRGVTHEMVRHRLFGFAQESTRYVNYTKEQFGNGDIKFIKPAGYDEWSADDRQFFDEGLVEAENRYNGLIARGFTPQQARAVLPSATKTEIIVTGNDAEWQHFFNLRSKGTTGAPHPDMKIVADMAFALYETA